VRIPENGRIREFLARQPVMILDGGLATQLEAAGADLSDRLWSARLLADDPDRIGRVHRDFLEAGADCIISASYQATAARFAESGRTVGEAEQLLARSVKLAFRARDAFWNEPANRKNRLRPLVAASIGPYGAYLADGSEYTGDYRVGEEELVRFHRDRWQLLSSAGPDLLACETVPSIHETAALCRLMEESPGPEAWITFSCRDGKHLGDGSDLAEAVCMAVRTGGFAGIGVNCVDPVLVPDLIRTVKDNSPLPIVVYPNSGERWDRERRCWTGDGNSVDLADLAGGWVEAGASVVGGCCRVGPETIGRLRSALLEAPSG
jgi:homocysteine S-methyltransferase